MSHFLSAHCIARVRRAAVIVLVAASALEPLRAQTESTTSDARPSFEHSNYLNRVREAMFAANMIKGMTVRKQIEMAIARQRRFGKDTAQALTTHARNLSNVGAVIFELEVPTLYAEWDKTMGAMDRAESAGLYRPPEDLRKKLVFWRAKRDDRLAIEAAPWVVGPTRVALDPNLVEVTIPPEVGYLNPAQCEALRTQRLAIRSAARAELATGTVPASAEHAPSSPACLRAADGSWSAGLAVIDRGYIELDRRVPWRADELLQQLRSKSRPAHDLMISSDAPEAELAVRWIIPPTIEAEPSSVRWSLTNGAQSEPLGIEYEFLKFGATQQVLITANELRAAEVVTEIEDLPEGYVKARFTADDVIGRMRQALAPLEQSLAFLPGHRYEDASADAPRNPVTLDQLIVGPPSGIEAAGRLPQDPPRPGFFAYLWAHPHYLASLLTALVAIAIAKTRASRRSARVADKSNPV